ncbi:O-antigen ligase family protein [Candidatus Uabimicrobium sp. HlEnr_7]|uniref:O-antigen ligase family protein n=1 Tax=Candidatus Uabimicrobium helgolandensis TaxID=3095367 RepID=UPI00355665CB
MQRIIKYNLYLQLFIASLCYGGNAAYVWGPLSILASINLLLVYNFESSNNKVLDIIVFLFFISLFMQFFIPNRLIQIPAFGTSSQITHSFSTLNTKWNIYQWLIPISAIIVIPRIVKSHSDILQICHFLVFIVCLQGFIGFIEYFFSRNSFLYDIYPFFGKKIGVTGTYVTRNIYANILAAGIPLVLAQIFIYQNKRSKLSVFTKDNFYICFYIVSCIIITSSIVLSKSRTGIAFYFCSALSFLFYNKNSRTITLIIILLTVLVCGVFFLGNQEVLQRFAHSKTDMDYRIAHYKAGLDIVKDHWLFGCGAGNFSIFFEMYRNVPIKIQYFHLDNDYIEFIAEHGIFPTLLGLLFLITWAKIAIQKPLQKNNVIYSSTVISVMVFFLFAGLHFSLHVNSHRMFLAYLMAILISNWPNNKETLECIEI